MDILDHAKITSTLEELKILHPVVISKTPLPGENVGKNEDSDSADDENIVGTNGAEKSKKSTKKGKKKEQVKKKTKFAKIRNPGTNNKTDYLIYVDKLTVLKAGDNNNN